MGQPAQPVRLTMRAQHCVTHGTVSWQPVGTFSSPAMNTCNQHHKRLSKSMIGSRCNKASTYGYSLTWYLRTVVWIIVHALERNSAILTHRNRIAVCLQNRRIVCVAPRFCMACSAAVKPALCANEIAVRPKMSFASASMAST